MYGAHKRNRLKRLPKDGSDPLCDLLESDELCLSLLQEGIEVARKLKLKNVDAPSLVKHRL